MRDAFFCRAKVSWDLKLSTQLDVPEVARFRAQWTRRSMVITIYYTVYRKPITISQYLRQASGARQLLKSCIVWRRFKLSLAMLNARLFGNFQQIM